VTQVKIPRGIFNVDVLEVVVVASRRQMRSALPFVIRRRFRHLRFRLTRLRYCPVMDSGSRTSRSVVPVATMAPSVLAGRRAPMSMTYSAVRNFISSSCSTTMSVFPRYSLGFFSVPMSRRLSAAGEDRCSAHQGCRAPQRGPEPIFAFASRIR